MATDVHGLRLPQSRTAVATLLDAVLAVSSDLDLAEVLARIVRGACDLAGARYGALGVLSPDGRGLMEFVVEGMTSREVARMAHPPHGDGILGLLINDPRPLRLENIADHPAAAGFPEGHPVMTTFLGVPIPVRGEVFGNLYLTEKVGGLAFTEDDEALVVALAASAGIAIENARLYETTRRQQQWSEALGEMSQVLLSGENQRDALSLLVDRVKAVAEAEMAAVALLDEESGALALEAVTGPDGRPSALVGTALTATHWYEVLETGEPLLLFSKAGESVADPPAGLLREGTGLPLHGQTAIVPMTVGERAVGLLIVGWGEGEGHVAYDAAEPLKRYADQAALSLTAATAQRARARMGLFADRERIARDMHDVVIQRLFATGLGLQSASRVAAHPVVQARLDEAVDELDLAIKDIRATIFQLHKGSHVALDTEIRELAGQFADPLGYAPQVSVEGSLEAVTEPLRTDLLAVIREGLSNVARHARATAVSIDLRARDGRIDVFIRDDGRGLRDSNRRSGLTNLRERAAVHGGSLHVESRHRQGTALTWSVPHDG
ncbi:MAG: GAF domain-containing protein [Dermatophilaceae bacterium]